MMSGVPVIAVTGGIGSGKSVVCRVLAAKGFRVYDCDSRAKKIVDTSACILERIGREICPEAIVACGGRITLDRRRLAEAVFSDPDRLDRLNALVHGAVIDDIRQWSARHADERKPLFVETAILYQSNLDKIVDGVWEVVAPKSLRLQRACARDNAGASEIEARMAVQNTEAGRRHEHVAVILNDGREAVLPQINRLLAGMESWLVG